MRISPCRHPGQPNAIFDDVVNLPVGEILGGGIAEIRRLGIEHLPDLSSPTPIVIVADRAAIDERVTRFAKKFGRGLKWVRLMRRAGGNRNISDESCNDALDRRGFVARAEAALDQKTAIHR